MEQNSHILQELPSEIEEKRSTLRTLNDSEAKLRERENVLKDAETRLEIREKQLATRLEDAEIKILELDVKSQANFTEKERLSELKTDFKRRKLDEIANIEKDKADLEQEKKKLKAGKAKFREAKRTANVDGQLDSKKHPLLMGN